MESAEILEILKELTLDLQAGKRNPVDTTAELHRRISADLVYVMDEKEPQRELITQVFVSLDNLMDEDFPPSAAEMQYFAECFEGKREFKLEEVRAFELVAKEEEKPSAKQRRVRIHPRQKIPRMGGKIFPTKPAIRNQSEKRNRVEPMQT